VSWGRAPERKPNSVAITTRATMTTSKKFTREV
jgi:hypothetical protein